MMRANLTGIRACSSARQVVGVVARAPQSSRLLASFILQGFAQSLNQVELAAFSVQATLLELLSQLSHALLAQTGNLLVDFLLLLFRNVNVGHLHSNRQVHRV